MKLLLHPLPVRIFHWTMFACVITLLFTGLYLHYPFDAVRLPVSMVRKVHLVFGFILTINLLGQIYYYLYTGKYTEVLLSRHDLPHLRSFFRYYLFITEHHPNFGRYNPGQKFIFTAWGLAVLVGAITGTGLLFSDQSQWLQKLLGGLHVMRFIQFFIAMFFAATIPLHLYLVFTEEPAKLQAMFTGYLNKEPKLPPPQR
ncbi:cytochrome b/b6 domain-containing protein [Sporolituus thermophilus]|uniref:Ni/Fe-hydrogenase 1 B-type cytochrome subunit n=1 Tax=Sporolituus thermophilus DSM 23256 TaxID=1123285 RepID=A0A1G7ITR5_9FIRM|nr:cytochrome b/b6 domain-containing protein [Sporolituus thermophilus]SDF16067.1 Ni/Fe-hydrogenase 1 B-type cytochrome subunit [Sporolituus thermophilus DSM 23256]